VIWRTKKGTLVHLLLSYVQVGYHGGHISFVGGKRVLWVYDITALTQQEAQVAEQESRSCLNMIIPDILTPPRHGNACRGICMIRQGCHNARRCRIQTKNGDGLNARP
jgi:hypothetical protein